MYLAIFPCSFAPFLTTDDDGCRWWKKGKTIAMRTRHFAVQFKEKSGKWPFCFHLHSSAHTSALYLFYCASSLSSRLLPLAPVGRSEKAERLEARSVIRVIFSRSRSSAEKNFRGLRDNFCNVRRLSIAGILPRMVRGMVN